MDNRSEYFVAMVFGVISPKISTRNVSIPVEYPINLLPKTSVQSAVVSAEAEMFTILFPINMALKSFAGLSVIFNTFFAGLLPSSALERSLILLTDVSAVSDEEKNAESKSKIIIITRIIQGLPSKKSSPLVNKIVF